MCCANSSGDTKSGANPQQNVGYMYCNIFVISVYVELWLLFECSVLCYFVIKVLYIVYF